MTGLIPAYGVSSMLETVGKNMYYTLVNQLRRAELFQPAYHPHTYNYYDRDLTHENLGYEKYLGYGNGLEDQVDDDYFAAVNQIVSNKFSFSKNVLNKDYYNILFRSEKNTGAPGMGATVFFSYHCETALFVLSGDNPVQLTHYLVGVQPVDPASLSHRLHLGGGTAHAVHAHLAQKVDHLRIEVHHLRHQIIARHDHIVPVHISPPSSLENGPAEVLSGPAIQ